MRVSAHIWFGEAYGITIESVPDEGTRVIVRIRASLSVFSVV